MPEDNTNQSAASQPENNQGPMQPTSGEVVQPSQAFVQELQTQQVAPTVGVQSPTQVPTATSMAAPQASPLMPPTNPMVGMSASQPAGTQYAE